MIKRNKTEQIVIIIYVIIIFFIIVSLLQNLFEKSSDATISGITVILLWVLFAFLVQFYKQPNLENLISEERLRKIAPKHLLVYLIYFPLMSFIYGMGTFKIPEIVSYSIQFSGILWFLLFRKELFQMIDIYLIYFYSDKFPGLWPSDFAKQEKTLNE